MIESAEGQLTTLDPTLILMTFDRIPEIIFSIHSYIIIN